VDTAKAGGESAAAAGAVGTAAGEEFGSACAALPGAVEAAAFVTRLFGVFGAEAAVISASRVVTGVTGVAGIAKGLAAAVASLAGALTGDFLSRCSKII
jgi:hypothetical protein